MIKKYTPLIFLTGVLFCSVLINFLPFTFKILLLTIFVLLFFLIVKLDIRLLLSNWYRFRYLLLSILILNYFFNSTQIWFAVDKLLLLLLMLTLVKIYLSMQSQTEIVGAVSLFLWPLSFIGVNSSQLASLFGSTLAYVDRLQNISITSNSKNLMHNAVHRLSEWILIIESNACECRDESNTTN